MNPETLEKLINDGRDSYEARLAAGQARAKNGDLDQAVAHFRAATEHAPQHTMAWQELGKALQAGGDPEGARAAWERGSTAARANGDKQAEKIIAVWLKRLDKR